VLNLEGHVVEAEVGHQQVLYSQVQSSESLAQDVLLVQIGGDLGEGHDEGNVRQLGEPNVVLLGAATELFSQQPDLVESAESQSEESSEVDVGELEEVSVVEVEEETESEDSEDEESELVSELEVALALVPEVVDLLSLAPEQVVQPHVPSMHQAAPPVHQAHGGSHDDVESKARHRVVPIRVFAGPGFLATALDSAVH
jgi:hypothetical protein